MTFCIVINRENLNVVDADGNTAVHLAAMMSKTECLKVLLRAGATDSLNLGWFDQLT